jgi:hypothetical protein
MWARGTIFGRLPFGRRSVPGKGGLQNLGHERTRACRAARTASGRADNGTGKIQSQLKKRLVLGLTDFLAQPTWTELAHRIVRAL